MNPSEQCVPKPEMDNKYPFTVDKTPIEYYNRISLCVLDTVRKLQEHSVFEKGVEKCHIVEYLKHQPYIDGDVCSQVSTTLRGLENNGYLMYMQNGYKTLGPYAKLCSSKTQKQRRLIWRKLEMKFSHSNTNIMMPIVPKYNRKVKSATDFRNIESISNISLNSQDIEMEEE